MTVCLSAPLLEKTSELSKPTRALSDDVVRASDARAAALRAGGNATRSMTTEEFIPPATTAEELARAAAAAAFAHALVPNPVMATLTGQPPPPVLTAGVASTSGHGDPEDQHEPKVIEALRGSHVVAIAAFGHSMVLTDQGDLLSFGYASGNRQLGAGDGNAYGIPYQLVPKVIAGGTPTMFRQTVA